MANRSKTQGEVVYSDSPQNILLTKLKEKDFKKLSHFLRIRIKSLISDVPAAVLIEPINTCNLRCPLCSLPQSHLKRKREEMSFEGFQYIVDEVKNHTISFLLSMAGEPLLNKEIAKMVNYASNNGLFVAIDTNATLLSPELAEGLLYSGLDEIFVSLDGCSKESYEGFRVNAELENVVENITTLCALKRIKNKATPLVTLECIANRLNENELWEIKKLGRKIGIDRFWVKSLAIPSHIYDEETCKEMATKFLPTNPNVKHRYRSGKLTSCTYWTRNTVILVDGTVAMCCYDLNGEYSFGNIYEDGFLNIWNSEKYRYYRKNLILHRKLPLCMRCPREG